MSGKLTKQVAIVAVLGGSISTLATTTVSAATITGWNTSNVAIDTSNTDGVTGSSEIYDRALNPDGSIPSGATTSGTVVFTPPEALSPGIKVQPEAYSDTGAGATLDFDGCLMTSNPGATCTSPFQSGKRIKQQVTGFDPVDLVFDVDNTDTSSSFYQVFGRLINVTGQTLDGFKVELGFGTGDDFVASSGQVTFSTGFTAPPNDSGLSSSTQYPFGLFGAADDSPNFLLDGFFASDRTGLTLEQTDTMLMTNGNYGDYSDLFGPWNTQQDVPNGLFWDFDDDPDTDALLMAWETGDGIWELRRTVGETCDIADDTNCTFGETLDTYKTGAFDDIVAMLTDTGDQWLDIFEMDAIEDLANLNLNYALDVSDLTGFSSFTIRTTAFPTDIAPSEVPLPASAPLMAAGFGLLAFVRRRRKINSRP